MQSLEQLLHDYGQIHSHPVNRALHGLGIPLIMLGSLGLLHLLPAVQVAGHVLDPLVAGVILASLALGRWSWRLTLGIQAAALIAFVSLAACLEMAGLALQWQAAIWGGGVIAGIVMHAIGHRVFEREPARFDQNLAFILAGPLSLAESLRRKFNPPG